jgi:hypothetical protein
LNGVSDGVTNRYMFPAVDGLNTICGYLIYQPRYIWCFGRIHVEAASGLEKQREKFFLAVVGGKPLSGERGDKCGFVIDAC